MALDKARRVDDELVLGTVGGGASFLAGDLARLGAQAIEGAGDVVRAHYAGSLEQLAGVRLYDVCGVALAPIRPNTMPSAAAVMARLSESLRSGLLGALTERPIRFRISPLRFGRWELRDLVARELGWSNDPGAWDVNLEVMGGWLAAQIGPLYWSRRFAKLERIPASTSPVVAALMVRLLDVAPGALICDPCCGAGTLLFEAAAAGALAIGGDVDRRALQAARQNLGRTAGLFRGDARRLPLPDGSLPRLVANLPFGKRVGSHRENLTFYPAFMTEAARVLGPGGRAVLLTEEKRLLRQAVERARGLRLERELALGTGGLHPSAFVLRARPKP